MKEKEAPIIYFSFYVSTMALKFILKTDSGKV